MPSNACKKLDGGEMEMPVCCGKRMKINMELGRFLEVQCGICGDIDYTKRYSRF
ncbi:MAG: hypothetical protein V1900_03555 [Candidatus Aenigmatarchaeota archaeon]